MEDVDLFDKKLNWYCGLCHTSNQGIYVEKRQRREIGRYIQMEKKMVGKFSE